MRKIVAFVLCMVIVTTAGFAVVHPAFVYITDWLGPVLGSSLLTVFSVLYLILGDPIQSMGIAVLWGAVAFLCGMLVRRRLGAVLTMLLVFLLMLPVLAVNVFDVAMAFGPIIESFKGSNPMAALPPLPEGLSLPHLYNTPILGPVIETVLGAMQSGGQLDPRVLLFGVATTLLMNVVVKIVVIIVAALAGVEVGKMIEPSFAPMSESVRTSLGGRPRAQGTIDTLKEALPAAFIIVLISSTVFLSIPLVSSVEDDYYGENLFGYADESGRAYVGDLFVESGAPVEGSDDAGELLAGLIVSHEGVREVLGALLGEEEGLESVANLLPETLMVAVYVDVPAETAGPESEGLAEAFSEAYGVDLTQFMAFSPPLPGAEEMEFPEISIVVYQSGAGFGDLAGSYLGHLADRGGLVDTLMGAASNGRLIPGATDESSDGGVLFSGFINFNPLIEYMPEEFLDNVTQFIPLDHPGFLGLSGGVSFWDNGVDAVGEGKGLDLLGLLGAEEAPSFSDSSELSLVVLASPNGTDVGGEESAPNVKITTSLEEGDPRLNTIHLALELLGLLNLAAPGEALSPESFEIEVTGVVLPLKVEVTRAVTPVDPQPGGTVEVTVTVENLDTEAMADVRLDDSEAVSRYTDSASVVEGDTSEIWRHIGPGRSESITYTIRLDESGVYSFTPAYVEYANVDKEFAEDSSWVEVRVARPAALGLGIGSLFSSWGKFGEILDTFGGGSVSTIAFGFIGLVIVVIAFFEVKNFTRWLAGGESPE